MIYDFVFNVEKCRNNILIIELSFNIIILVFRVTVLNLLLTKEDFMKNNNRGDILLVEKLVSGNQMAFKSLFNRYAKRIYNFSFSYLHNEHQSEELVQDVFLKIWENRKNIDSSKNFKSYLFKICVNLIYDYLRKESNKFKFIESVEIEEGEDKTYNDVLYNETKERLEKLTNKMPEQRRKIFNLNKIEGLSHNEIAHKLNISVRTVESQVYKSVKFLKEHLNEESLIVLIFLNIFFEF